MATKTTSRKTTRKAPARKGIRKATARRARKQTSAIGRPSLLTPELEAQFVELLAAGHFFHTVARHLGVGRSTAFNWLERGRRELTRLEAYESEGVTDAADPREAPYLSFLFAVDKADVASEMKAVETLVDLMDPKVESNVRRLAAKDLGTLRHGWSTTERQEITVQTSHRIELTINEQQERTNVIVEGLLEVRAVDALAAQRALAESGEIEEED